MVTLGSILSPAALVQSNFFLELDLVYFSGEEGLFWSFLFLSGQTANQDTKKNLMAFGLV